MNTLYIRVSKFYFSSVCPFNEDEPTQSRYALPPGQGCKIQNPDILWISAVGIIGLIYLLL